MSLRLAARTSNGVQGGHIVRTADLVRDGLISGSCVLHKPLHPGEELKAALLRNMAAHKSLHPGEEYTVMEPKQGISVPRRHCAPGQRESPLSFAAIMKTGQRAGVPPLPCFQCTVQELFRRHPEFENNTFRMSFSQNVIFSDSYPSPSFSSYTRQHRT